MIPAKKNIFLKFQTWNLAHFWPLVASKLQNFTLAVIAVSTDLHTGAIQSLMRTSAARVPSTFASRNSGVHLLHQLKCAKLAKPPLAWPKCTCRKFSMLKWHQSKPWKLSNSFRVFWKFDSFCLGHCYSRFFFFIGLYWNILPYVILILF